ncbi:substrate-binding periplasmic protein [Psychromonas aquimarina]|uniref:substrate-binding periplasmic protein n=1 Tax=Psychromonas aquimarina TaxID=444919 RepID=UPI000490F449|nr:transporter substrate-binding domain-containing protein [Psychromonas aquimarina]
MSCRRIFGVAVIALGLAAYASLGMGQPVKKVRLVIDPWYPWVIGQPSGDNPSGGVGVELIEELFKRIGVETEINLFPFKRVITYLEAGKADGSWLITKNSAREKFVIFSDPLFSDYYYLYYSDKRKTPFEWNTWEDLKHYEIGLTSGFDYGEELISSY